MARRSCLESIGKEMKEFVLPVSLQIEKMLPSALRHHHLSDFALSTEGIEYAHWIKPPRCPYSQYIQPTIAVNAHLNALVASYSHCTTRRTSQMLFVDARSR